MMTLTEMTPGQRRAISGAPKKGTKTRLPSGDSEIPIPTDPERIPEVDVEHLIKTFEPEFIDKCRTVRSKIKVYDGFHTPAGRYVLTSEAVRRYEDKGLGPFLDTMWFPNLAFVEWISKNKELFVDKLFLDFGCGWGFLSVFLEHINLKCLCYDNYHSTRPEDLRHVLSEFSLQDRIVTYDQIENIDVFMIFGVEINDEDRRLLARSKHTFFVANLIRERFTTEVQQFEMIQQISLPKMGERYDYVEVWKRR